MDHPTNCTQPKENHNSPTLYYGVYIPNEAKDYTVAPNVFEDKLEALKVAKKNKKSRFKAFHFYHEAAEFADNGSEFPNNSAPTGLFFNKDPEPTQTIGEKASPFKGPKPQDLIELRKAIENGHYQIVRDTIWQNPRYLVSSGDTPSILQEGARYNALHVAAKSRNAQITELILTTVSNIDFIKLLYGDDNQQNAEDRTAVLLDLYLNTPNKGLNETPLHFASKHGAAEVVEILVSYPQCDKTLRNKFNKTAEEVICERAEGYNLPEIKKKIQMLLRDSYYVPILRAEDKSMAPVIGEPFSPTKPLVFNNDPLSPRFAIHAYAGPMDHKGAQDFRKMWKTPPRSLNMNSPKKIPKDIVNVSSLRFKDPDKGLERIGNKLAHKYDVNWKEYWPFLGSFVDISSEEGLTMLESHLTNRYASIYNDCSLEELKNDTPEVNKSDILSPISNLCQAFSTFHINDSSRSVNLSPEKKTDVDSVTYIDCACQVFAKRISNDILHVLYSEENILQVLEIEIKKLELLITSYMEDERFSCINFQKIHSRLGLLVGQKLYNNIKEEVRVYLCSKLENDLDIIMKSVDCFSSDDESHLKEISAVRKPTIYKKQLICLIHFILNVLSQNYDSKQTGNEEDCFRDWENAEACSCIYHMRKSKRNSLSRSSSFKNSKLLQKNELDGASKRLYYEEPSHGDSDVMNGLNSSLNLNHIAFSSDEDSDDESEEKFYTPPSSPSLLMDYSGSEDEFDDTELPKQDVYIESEHPTKLDLEVFNAINYAETTIDRTKYPNVYKWYHSISLYDQEERERWPCFKDRYKADNVSPNASLCNNNSFSMDSPKTSTPSKSWLRITGANSPKAVLKSSSIRM